MRRAAIVTALLLFAGSVVAADAPSTPAATDKAVKPTTASQPKASEATAVAAEAKPTAQTPPAVCDPLVASAVRNNEPAKDATGVPEWIAKGGFTVSPGAKRDDVPACPEVHPCLYFCLDPCTGQCRAKGGTCSTVDTGHAACQTGGFYISCSGGKTIHTTTCGCTCPPGGCGDCPGNTLTAFCE